MLKMKSNKTEKEVFSLKALLVLVVSLVVLFAPDLVLANTVDLSSLGSNIDKQATGIKKVINAIALVAGIGFVVASLFMANAAGKPQSQMTWKMVIITFIVGSAMLSYSAIAFIGSNTLGVNQDAVMASLHFIHVLRA